MPPERDRRPRPARARRPDDELGADELPRVEERAEGRDRHRVEIEIDPALAKQNGGPEDVRPRDRCGDLPMERHQCFADADRAADVAKAGLRIERRETDVSGGLECPTFGAVRERLGVMQRDTGDAAPPGGRKDREHVGPGDRRPDPDEMHVRRNAHRDGRAPTPPGASDRSFIAHA